MVSEKWLKPAWLCTFDKVRSLLFYNFLKKFKINSIKHLTTVTNCYILFNVRRMITYEYYN